jgi:hypothetical protein
MLALTYRVDRNGWGGFFYSLLPVYGVAFLTLVVFWLPEGDLCTRIEVISGLFLALIGKCQQSTSLKCELGHFNRLSIAGPGHTPQPQPGTHDACNLATPTEIFMLSLLVAAIQFVVGDSYVSRQAYVSPVQLTTYITAGFMVMIAAESVLIYHIINWNAFKQSRKVRILSHAYRVMLLQNCMLYHFLQDMFEAARQHTMGRKTSTVAVGGNHSASAGEQFSIDKSAEAASDEELEASTTKRKQGCLSACWKENGSCRAWWKVPLILVQASVVVSDRVLGAALPCREYLQANVLLLPTLTSDSLLMSSTIPA